MNGYHFSNSTVMLLILFLSIFVSGHNALAASFTDNGNGTVTDGDTWLIWQKEDDNRPRQWKAAVSYCESLSLAGHSDWRLPYKKELMTLVDRGWENPTIDMSFFPNTKSFRYWTSTPYESKKSFVWVMFFRNGAIYGDFKLYHYYSRCVRNEQ